MKRSIALIAAAVLGLGMAGCSSGNSASTPSGSSAQTPMSTASSSAPSPATSTAEHTLTSQDNKLTDTDKDATAVEGSGFEITIDQSAKTATFQFIDPASGEAFQNYGEFNYADNTYLRHLVSSAMGKTYNYTFDLTSNTLVSVFDDEGNDLSQSTKDNGRWEKAEAETGDQAQAIQDYFQARYGMSIKDATLG